MCKAPGVILKVHLAWHTGYLINSQNIDDSHKATPSLKRKDTSLNITWLQKEFIASVSVEEFIRW